MVEVIIKEFKSVNEISKELLNEADGRLNNGADYLLSQSKRNIIKNKLVDRGILLRSGFVVRKFLQKTIGFSAPHAGPTEFGTRPHMPPVEPLIGWARRVLRLSVKKAIKAAWAIAIDIKKNGTIPRPWFRPAIKALIRRGI